MSFWSLFAYFPGVPPQLLQKFAQVMYHNYIIAYSLCLLILTSHHDSQVLRDPSLLPPLEDTNTSRIYKGGHPCCGASADSCDSGGMGTLRPS
jgi:hypothetical protein